MNPNYRWLCLAIGLAAAGPVDGAPLFEEEAVLEIGLTGPFSELFSNRAERVEYPFTLETGGAGFELDVRVRGKSRIRVCDFPPLRLNFERGHTAGTAFAGQHRLKLVTHCINDDRGEIDLLEEYVAYRLFRVLSDFSYRVRLLRLRYADSTGKLDHGARERFGFVIESTRELAARTGTEPLDVAALGLSRVHSDQAARVFVFQYLIGNTDWSFVTSDGEQHCCHNGKLLSGGDGIYYVPFDFDLAGLVNAPYAKPDPSLRLRNVRKRRYRGYCMDDAALQSALRQVVAERANLLGVAASTPGLDAADRTRITEYLESFFERAADEQKMLKSFARQCLD